MTQRRVQFGLQTLSVCVASLCLISVSADETARNWFARMNQAVEQLNYRGTFVHLQNNRLETMEVLHKVENQRVYERLTARSGPPREFIRDGEEFQCIVESRKEVMVDRWKNKNPLTASLPVYKDELNKYYRFKHVDHNDQVAGRSTVFIGIVPTDPYRYGYRLWLDKETAMPLICELVDQSGQIIETLQFTHIEFDPEFADDAFKPTLNTKDFRWITPSKERQQADLKDSQWRAEQVPGGFELSVSSVEEVAGKSRVEHYVYSDGLASVSVFAEPRSPDHQVLDGASKLGAANAFGRIEGDFQITVVGEVPPDTVKIIGNSFRPKQ